MGSYGIFMLFDLIIVFGGVYFLYAAFMLKFKNKVAASLMLPKEMEFKKCRDIENYKKYMCWRTFVAGVVLLLSGVVSCLGDVYPLFHVISGWFFLPGLAAIIWFAIFSKKGLEQYFK